MDQFINALKAHASRMDGQMPQPRWGIVQSVDPTRPAVKVLIEPEGVLSGWLPLGQMMAGNGWTFLALPVPGDMAIMVPDAGSSSAYVVTGFGHNDGALPPPVPAANGGGTVALEAGEIVAVSKGGAILRFVSDGTIFAKAAAFNIQAPVNILGNVAVTGNLTTTGEVTAGFGGGDQVGLQTHTHPVPNAVALGPAPTDAPTPGS